MVDTVGGVYDLCIHYVVFEINTYGKEYILKYNKNMKGKTLDL